MRRQSGERGDGDRAFGRNGDDRLDGGQGDDTFFVGAGDNTLVYSDANFGADVVRGFTSGFDRLEISADIAASIDDVSIETVAPAQGCKAYTLVSFSDAGGSIKVYGLGRSMLTADDIVIVGDDETANQASMLNRLMSDVETGAVRMAEEPYATDPALLLSANASAQTSAQTPAQMRVNPSETGESQFETNLLEDAMRIDVGDDALIA